MKIVKQIATNSDCYRCNKQIRVQGLMLHSVGCSQPDPAVFAKQWNSANWNVCAHAVLGADGKVIQTLPWNWRGWHGGGSSNNTHIGVEMTEPATIQYTSGANWREKSDGTNTKKHVLGTYNTAVELFAYLCKEYDLDPLKDGVIVSHSEGYKRGIATAHADVEHIWRKYNLTMDKFRKDVKAAMSAKQDKVENPVEKVDNSNLTKIMGESKLSLSQLEAYSAKQGVSSDYIKLIPVYLSEGSKEGVRGDIAYAQSLVETGNFRFQGDVLPEQNNFAGLGTTGNGVRGEYFSSPEIGIRAQIQHLKAYASTAELSQTCVDTRFKYVTRGCAPYVEYLGIPDNPQGKGWAAAKGYGKIILKVMSAISTLTDSETEEYSDSLYRVRLSWDNPSSQIGAFSKLEYAKSLVDTRPEYKVFDETGKVVYSKGNVSSGTAKDKAVSPYRVSLAKGTKVYAKPSKDAAVVQTISERGVYTIVAENNGYYKLKSGIGYVKEFISKGDAKPQSGSTSSANSSKASQTNPKLVKVTVGCLNIRDNPNGKIVSQITDKGTYTIVEERDGWGRLKSGAGWVSLEYTKVVR